jgi:hypothetical protein
MPLKLVPPRQGKSPNWTIRGTYLKHHIDHTTGTPDKKLAAKILELSRALRELERARQQSRVTDTRTGEIHIHTHATDAAGIARDIKPALERTTMAVHANYSLARAFFI